jgi:AcrR family transcriptional regulator
MTTLPRHLSGPALGRQTVSRDVLGVHQEYRVLDAATTVFAERGYQGTTVRDILSAGRMGPANFYSLFESKEGCFLAALDLAVGRTREEMAAATARSEDWAEQTYLGLRALLGSLLRSPLAARLVLLEAQGAGPVGASRYNALLEAGCAWLARGRDPRGPQLPPSYEQATVPGLAFYLQQCVLEPRSYDLETLLEEASTMLLEPMIGRDGLAAMRRSVAELAP